MPVNLIEAIGRDYLWATFKEVAAHLQENLSNLEELQFWGVGLWVKRRHDLAKVISYRHLSCWIPALRQTILASSNLERLRELQTALEVDFEKRSNAYSDETRQELRELIEQRQEQLEADDAPLWKAEMLASGDSAMINNCKTKAELEWVRQIIREQAPYLKSHPHLIDGLQQIWMQKARILCGLAIA